MSRVHVWEVGSLSPDAAEVKSISHTFVKESGCLSKVAFSKVTAMEDPDE